MRKFYAMIGVAMVCLVLCTCQGPQLQPFVESSASPPPASTSPATPTLTPMSPPEPSPTFRAPVVSKQTVTQASAPIPTLTDPTACASHPGQPWRTWRVIRQPPVVQALITDQGAVWAGTLLGVFRVDPRTGTVTQSLDSKVAGEVRKLFPLGEGRLWADGSNGPFYFDGRQWTPLIITGTLGMPDIWAVDLNGDVLVREYRSRMDIYYSLSGHIPPSAPSAWKAIRTNKWVDQYTIGRCELQAFISSGFSFRSQAECQALNMAYQQVGAPVALDADGSIWWIRSEYVDQKNRRTVLGHVLSGQYSLTQTVPVESVYAMAADPSHGIWLGTEKELFYSDGYQVRQVSLGLSACTISFDPFGPPVDSQGKVWIGGYGIHVLSPGETEWQLVSESDQAGPESARFITAIAPARDGGMWVTHGYDLLHLGGSITVQPVQMLDPGCIVNYLAVNADSVWMLSDCGILQFIVSKGNWVRHNPSNSRVALMVIGSDSAVYAGSPDGLYANTGSEWHQVIQEDVTVAAADRQGGLWLASREQGELWYYKSGQLTPHGQQFDKHALQGLTVDSRNRLWAALSDALLLYDGKTWRRVRAPLEKIGGIQSSRNGHVWVFGWVFGVSGFAEYDPAMDKQP